MAKSSLMAGNAMLIEELMKGGINEAKAAMINAYLFVSSLALVGI